MIILLALLALSLCRSSYTVIDSYSNSTSYVLLLNYTGKASYYEKPTSPIIKQLKFTFHCLAFNDFFFKITDPNNKRFEIPQEGIFPVDPYTNFSYPISASAVRFEYNTDPFDFILTRAATGSVLFSTLNTDFIFSDHYIQIGSEVNSEYIYGIGQRFQEGFRRKDGKWTIFNRDRGKVIDKGTGLQTYGFYPFYLLREKNNLFHINYLRNSNAMDVVKSTVEGNHYIVYKVIGGILDFRFFLTEDNPELVIEKLNLHSGKSALPPFWSLGFHQSKHGYHNITYLQNVMKGYEENDLPLDTIWTDIEYMVDYEDFTFD